MLFGVEGYYGCTYLHKEVQQKISTWHRHKDNKGIRNMSRGCSRQKIEATMHLRQ